ncbi:MAG: hypothetical protein ACD_70C00080G0002 [uncultured bacterium]|nr:MAG: hypothetical protein ACD_70C00080G0002 [uncultured bacterium]OGT27177.1 MAG: hypothetical protein A3B71_08735 [Gammaproteobacteria bacterium RIFCSPHIGHO2_02_FULL_42_43]OGT28598.1 MAG: hypothetical protein A2624_06535 [Gammaproteobacteria bacterium RIFCSPHIGHO2_01_FULL_42_8]OGT50793.1 MAG: hypothetical protein A3E54_00930 [Gammaproteobacteria bacterium RIFCSPHIGHO2_12_FULL_41_25]OGT61777.1 MAG: hypothetical protein A3I77_00650 [Gammaproteobacteria bacterium RIFCSPLOWO2_02_FULL_42_14]OGT
MNDLQKLFQSLQAIDHNQPEEKIIQAVVPLVQACIANKDRWFEKRFCAVNEEQGFGSHLIAENPDHTLPIIITAWPKNGGTPPHDHDTWAVIGCVFGVEKNVLWKRHDDGSNPAYADITPDKTKVCRSGDIITMRKKDIHTVSNPEKETSISLHVYGKHFNFTNRHQFDPITHQVTPFIVKQFK